MSAESMNFLSELLLIQDIKVDGSEAFDKTAIANHMTGSSDLCVVVKKANASDIITEVKVEHSDDNVNFTEVVDPNIPAVTNVVIKETLPLNTNLIYERIGLKEDQLKRYVKVTVTGTAAQASFIIASKI